MTNKTIFYVTEGTNTHITSMEVELAQLMPIEVELTIVKATLTSRDVQIASLEKLMKRLQDWLSMPAPD